jgi:hypothetical protein
MRKIAVAACTVLALGSLDVIATPAHADSAGAAIAAGIGGLALGAMAGGALAAPPPPAYYPAPAPVYVQRPRCWRENRPIFDEYGDVVGYRPRRVCE